MRVPKLMDFDFSHLVLLGNRSHPVNNGAWPDMPIVLIGEYRLCLMAGVEAESEVDLSLFFAPCLQDIERAIIQTYNPLGCFGFRSIHNNPFFPDSKRFVNIQPLAGEVHIFPGQGEYFAFAGPGEREHAEKSKPLLIPFLFQAVQKCEELIF